jgi:hypothetical protein
LKTKPKSIPPIPPPDPMELAKLAVRLQPLDLSRGLRQAMELYVAAVLYCDALPLSAWAAYVSVECKMAWPGTIIKEMERITGVKVNARS